MAKAKAGVIDRGDLKRSQRALRKMDKSLPREGKDILRASAVKTAKVANQRLRTTPLGSYDHRLVNLRPYATQRDAGVRATRTARKPILHAFEYGASTWHIPNYRGPNRPGSVRSVEASTLDRRVMPPHLSESRTNTVGVRDGYVVAPVIKHMAKSIDQDLRQAFQAVFDREQNRQGVPRG